jgi:hypothetical protein
MADTDTDLIHNVTTGTIAGGHPEDEPVTVLAAPSVGQELNTIRAFLTPTGCWKVEDLLFEFDSSMVRPTVKEEFPTLFQLMEDHSLKDLDSDETRLPVLSIFGHADPVGKDEYNKALSGRRAAAIYGMLTRRDEIWESLFQNKGGFAPPAAGDKWGANALTIMRTALGIDPPDGNGKLPEETDSTARKALFLAYMDFCCVDTDGNPFKVDPVTGFLARNSSKDGVGDVQGCGEFNPVLLFSKSDKIELDRNENQPERNKKNEPNRRVMVLLFEPGAKIDHTKWPCPAVNQGVAKCKARFYSDARERIRNDEEERRFEKTKDTFACRFYDRLAFRSPCEALDRASLSHISLLLRSNSGSVPVSGKKYRIRISDKRILEGTTDDEGLVSHTLVPPGDYPLELEGLEGELIVPTLPTHLTRRATRVPGFFLESQQFAEVQVVDGKGKPIPGTSVVLVKPDGTKVPATTDGNGVVRFEGLTPQDVRITFDEAGFYPDEEQNVFPVAGTTETSKQSSDASASVSASPEPGEADVEIEEQYVDRLNVKDTDTPEEG